MVCVVQYSVPGYRCVPLLQALNGYQLEREEDEEGEGAGQEGEGEGEGEEKETEEDKKREELGDSLQL